MGDRRPAVLVVVLAVAGCAPAVLPPSATPPRALPSIDLPSARAGVLPPPPNSFDPAEIQLPTHLGASGRVGMWVGPIADASSARALVEPQPEGSVSYEDALVLADGRVVAIRATGGATPRSDLILIERDGTVGVLLDRAGPHPAMSADGRTIVVSRTDARLEDEGIWAVHLGNGQADQVLAPVPASVGVERASLAISRDGQSIAAAACNELLQVRFGDRDGERLEAGIPLGFDRRGRLLSQVDCAHAEVVRFAPGDNSPEPMVPTGGDYSAIVTEDGAILAVRNPLLLPNQLQLIDLETDEQRTTALADGPWSFVRQANSRFIVLRQSLNGGVLGSWYAVHDLVDAWTGYLRVNALPDDT